LKFRGRGKMKMRKRSRSRIKRKMRRGNAGVCCAGRPCGMVLAV
jgi:hypothetical protein